VVRVVDDIDHLRPGLRMVATVGVFDGVHLGHLHVLERLRDLAAELDAAPVAITFDPHPQAVITGRTPDLICDPHERITRIADAGAEVIVVQRFDEAFRSQSAEEFLERLARGRDLAGLVMSHESAFGRDRQGTVETVQRLAARDGWRLVEVDTLEVDSAPVSSSRIRGAVTAGDLPTAERLLGRPYAVSGLLGREDTGRGRPFRPMGTFVLPPEGRYTVEMTRSDTEGVEGSAAGAVATRSVDIDADGCVWLRSQPGSGAGGDSTVRMRFLERLDP
jgi:riboflavin kinase/FMN adenylyltransferase